MANVAKDFAQLISQSKSNKTGPYDTQATVKRVEGNTVWVSIPGGVDETPIDKTVNCTAGDKVQVRVSGGRAWITGNASAPPTDDKTAVQAQIVAIEAKETADGVSDIAEAAQASAATAASAAASAVTAAHSAQSSADNASEYAARALGNLSTVQSVAETLTWITQHGTMTLTTDVTPDPTHVYFVVDAGGDYTVGGTTYAIVTEPVTADMGTYYELSIDESLNNYVGTHLALDGEGLWLLPASTGTNKVLIATGAGSTYTTAGTYIIDSGGTTVASFRANGATIGENASGKSRSEIGTSGMQIIQNVSGVDTTIANLGYGPGNDSGGGTSDAPYYTLGVRTGTVGNYSVAEGNNAKASGPFSHAEGNQCEAIMTATHAEGNHTQAVDIASHAEGNFTIAQASYSHAEGRLTEARGGGAHAEGQYSVAEGAASHAQNFYTIAYSDYQTALGKYNIKDYADTYAVIIGNGTADNARSNALAVKWSGDVEAAGSITAEGHDSPIGYRPARATGSYSLASGTSWTTVPSSGLARTTLSPGVWIIQAQAIYVSNSTGWRALRIYDVTASEAIARSGVTQPAVNGATTNLTTMAIISLTASSTFTLQVIQNSGSSRNVDLQLDAVRIA